MYFVTLLIFLTFTVTTIVNAGTTTQPDYDSTTLYDEYECRESTNANFIIKVLNNDDSTASTHEFGSTFHIEKTQHVAIQLNKVSSRLTFRLFELKLDFLMGKKTRARVVFYTSGETKVLTVKRGLRVFSVGDQFPAGGLENVKKVEVKLSAADSLRVVSIDACTQCAQYTLDYDNQLDFYITLKKTSRDTNVKDALLTSSKVLEIESSNVITIRSMRSTLFALKDIIFKVKGTDKVKLEIRDGSDKAVIFGRTFRTTGPKWTEVRYTEGVINDVFSVTLNFIGTKGVPFVEVKNLYLKGCVFPELWQPSDGRTREEFFQTHGFPTKEFNQIKIMAPKVKSLMAQLYGYPLPIEDDSVFFDGDMIFDASQLQTLYNELRSMLPNNVKPVAKRRKKRRIIDFASHSEYLWSKRIPYFIDNYLVGNCSLMFFEKMMCQVNFIIEIDTYTSELKSKPLMPWLIGSATPEFTRKLNVLKEQ